MLHLFSNGRGAKEALTALTLEWADLRETLDGYVASGQFDHWPHIRDLSLPAVWEAIHADLSELEPVVAVEPAFVGRRTWKQFWARIGDLRRGLKAMRKAIDQAQREGVI